MIAEILKIEELEPSFRKWDLEVEDNHNYCVEGVLVHNSRQTVHFLKTGNLSFSRRESVKTGWFCENTNLLPHIRYIKCDGLEGTVLDGELFIQGKQFKEIASVMNCSWEKAVTRQLELGFVCLNAFDIIWYKGINVTSLPLHRRKELLKEVVRELHSEYIKELPYHRKLVPIFLDKRSPVIQILREDQLKFKKIYPDLFNTIRKFTLEELLRGKLVLLSKKAYYEYIVASGGEGIIIKDMYGKYLHKRGREYTKLKKFLTKDVVILGFADPTLEYKGKNPTPKDWRYWLNYEQDLFDTSNPKDLAMVENSIDECCAVSKYYYNNWVGNIIFGVTVSKADKEKLLKSKKGKEFKFKLLKDIEYLVVGECSGFNEEIREQFSEDRDSFIGKVIEVLANELFKNTGRLRHPRFAHVRFDKNADQCTWKDHIND